MTRPQRPVITLVAMRADKSPPVGVLVIACWNESCGLRARLTYTTLGDQRGVATSVASSSGAIINHVREWLSQLEEVGRDPP